MRCRHIQHSNVDGVCQQGGGHFTATLVRNGRGLDAHRLVEPLGLQLQGRGADAQVQGPGTGLCFLDQVFEALDSRRCPRHKHNGPRCQDAHGYKVRQGIVGQALGGGGVHCKRRRTPDQQRISVARRGEHVLCTDQATCARPVVRNHRLTREFCQSLGIQAADEIGGARWRKWNDHANGPHGKGIALRRRRPCTCSPHRQTGGHELHGGSPVQVGRAIRSPWMSLGKCSIHIVSRECSMRPALTDQAKVQAPQRCGPDVDGVQRP
ncbi:hypothetical protein D9M72_320970 [compost metagenome]